MDRRAYLRGVAGVSVIGLSGCLSASGGSEYDIGMSIHAFEPQRFTVDVGDTVVWRNTSAHAHTITAFEETLPAEAIFFSSGDFENEQSAREAWSDGTAGSLYQGDTFSHTFEVAGEYPYFCIPHERNGMVGTIIVE
jgi:plastocyanin